MNKQVVNYQGMDLVKREYLEKNMRDTEFAEYMSEKTGYKYSVAQVRSYRQALGIGVVNREAQAEALLQECLTNPLPEALAARIKEFLSS